VLAAWEFLQRLERMPSPAMHQAPLRIVTPAWWRLVVRPDKTVDRRAYTFCALQAIHAAFKRRDLYVTPSERWGDPRAQLLTAQAWQAQRTQACRMLGLHEQPAPVLERLAQELDAAYHRTAANLPTNDAVHIERAHGRQELVLSGLGKLDEPPSLLALRTLVAQRLPRVELAERLLEVQAWTGFASDFTHVNEHGARADDLPISVCAVLLAEACNVGLEPLIRPEMPALTRARLAWIQQSYLRADTITNANVRLVDVHASLPLASVLGAHHLGGLRPGEVLSVHLDDVQYGRRRVIVRHRTDHPRGARSKSRTERVVDLHEPAALEAVSHYVMDEPAREAETPIVFLVGGHGQRRLVHQLRRRKQEPIPGLVSTGSARHAQHRL
jgi:Tn3 transposase DDE domain